MDIIEFRSLNFFEKVSIRQAFTVETGLFPISDQNNLRCIFEGRVNTQFIPEFIEFIKSIKAFSHRDGTELIFDNKISIVPFIF